MSVYFATVGDYLKIGYSRDPIGRMTTVTRLGKRPDDVPFNASPDLIGWTPGDRGAEAAMHRRFSAHRTVGEWFEGVDLDVVRDLIWSDPRGIDVQRMSAWAVFVACNQPELTREEMAAAGVPVEGKVIPDGAVGAAFWDALEGRSA